VAASATRFIGGRDGRGAGRGGRGRAARVSVPIYPTLHRRHFAAVLCIVVLEIFVLLSAGVIHNYQSSLLVIYFC